MPVKRIRAPANTGRGCVPFGSGSGGRGGSSRGAAVEVVRESSRVAAGRAVAKLAAAENIKIVGTAAGGGIRTAPIHRRRIGRHPFSKTACSGCLTIPHVPVEKSIAEGHGAAGSWRGNRVDDHQRGGPNRITAERWVRNRITRGARGNLSRHVIADVISRLGRVAGKGVANPGVLENIPQVSGPSHDSSGCR